MDKSDNLTKKSTGEQEGSHRMFLPFAWLIVLAIILLSLGGLGVYQYEHGKVVKVQQQLTKARQNNNDLKSEVATLNKKLTNMASQQKDQAKTNNVGTTQTNTAVADKLNIKVLDAYKYYTTKYPTKPYIVVDVTLTNMDTSSLTLPLSSFSLVDSSNNSGADFGELAGMTMPNGKAILGDQTLSAGQAITGALAFSAFDGNYSLYTLNYKQQSFSINANTSVLQ